MFDILYTVAFGLFCLDIILRMLSVPGYFGFNCSSALHRTIKACCRKGTARRPQYYDAYEKPLHIGSFLFWCDVLSTLTMLYGISYINKSQSEMIVVDIQLDPYGIPVRSVAPHFLIPLFPLFAYYLLCLLMRAIHFSFFVT